MGGVKNWDFSINGVVQGLESYQVFTKVLPLVAPMEVHAVDFGGDSTSRDHKNIKN